jgi:hypothetical protein
MVAAFCVVAPAMPGENANGHVRRENANGQTLAPERYHDMFCGSSLPTITEQYGIGRQHC